MKRVVEKCKELIFGHIGIFILLLCIVPFLLIGVGLFRGVDVL